MNGHSLKLAYRKLLKHKSFTLINLAGLAITLAASIIIFVYISYEFSYDKHIPDSERTYRIITRYQDGNFSARTFACYGDAISNRPEVENLTTFINPSNSIVIIDESVFTVPESVIADTSFLDFFALEMISGRKEDIGQPDIVFITADLAGKFFPGTDPMGREIFLRQFEGNTADSLGYFTIGGIVNPLPGNTHFGFQMIFSQKGNFSGLMNNLKGGKTYGANVYVRLYQDFLAIKLESDMAETLVPFLDGTFGPPLEAFNSRLQAVRDIHFTSDINREPRPVTRKSMIFILLTVGILILILMTSNFISTVIVQSHQQRKESGIMRTFGASKLQLIQVSLMRVAVFVGLSLVLSWIIIGMMGSYLEDIFVSGWSFRPLSLRILITGLLAALPVIFLASLGMHVSRSKYSTVELLRGEAPSSRSTFSVFGMLTVIQFGIVIVLLGFSILIGRQLRYMDNKDLGYSAENIYIVRIPAQQPRGGILVNEIKKHAGVISASTAHHHPGDVFQQMEFTAGGKNYQFGFRMVDPGVFETLGIGLLKKYGSSNGEIDGWVINETFYNQLLQDFTDDDIATSNFSVKNDDPDDSRTRFVVAGVMKDFHFSSLHSSIGNFAFVMRHPETEYNRWLMVRCQEGQSEAVLAAINDMMDTYFPGRYYESFLLEDNLNTKYKAAQNLSGIIGTLTVLSIIIACFGLYGLSLFITQRRTKEIGIRKVHGASSWQVVSMLNLEFLKWVGSAIVIASPIALWAIKRWLDNFAYRTTPAWWIFLLAGFVIAGIAMMAVTWQTVTSARRNPVDAIRYE